MRRQSNASKTGGKGAARMREFGYTASTVWFDRRELAAVRAAAEKAGEPLATWIRRAAVEAAGVHFVAR